MNKAPFFRRVFRITRHHADSTRDVRDEFELHLEMRTDELVAEGWSESAARREAERTFGDRRLIEAECCGLTQERQSRRRRLDFLDALQMDMRQAVREIRRHGMVSTMIVATLAITLGLNLAVFSTVQSVVWEPLPFSEPDRIVRILNQYPAMEELRANSSVPDLFDRRQLEALEEVALFQTRTQAVGEQGTLTQAFSMNVTPSFFQVLGVFPALGGGFSGEAANPAPHPEVIVSHGFWQEYLGGRPSLGKTLRVEGEGRKIVGIMPEDHFFPGWETKIWLPLSFSDQQMADSARHRNSFQMIARLAPGASVEQAQAQVDSLNVANTDRLPASIQTRIRESGFRSRVVSFQDDLVHESRPWLYLLAAGALFVGLISAVSLTNLLLVRASARLREWATRHALGAGRGRLQLRLWVESGILSTIGSGFGSVLGLAVLQQLRGFEAYEIPRIERLTMSPAVAISAISAVFLIMALASAVALGTTLRGSLFPVLRGGAATANRSQSLVRSVLVSVQIAVAFVLLVGAGLMTRSLTNVLSVDLGFEPDGVVAGAVFLPPGLYSTPVDRDGFFHRWTTEMEQIPGIERAAVASQIPFSGVDESAFVQPKEGWNDQQRQRSRPSLLTAVSPGYFDVMGIPLLSGRLFDSRDQRDGPLTILVSAGLARRLGANDGRTGSDVVGRQVMLGEEVAEDADGYTIVGVVGDVVHDRPTSTTRPDSIYLAQTQANIRFARILARGDLEAGATLGEMRARVRDIDPSRTFFWNERLERTVNAALIPFRVPVGLLAVFSGIALMLAVLGIYGVVAQSVTQRSKDIGIRLALGGSKAHILRSILVSTVRFVALGVGLGLLASLAVVGLLESSLYGVQPMDPGVLGMVLLIMPIIAAVATLIPARRAALIDPVQVLSTD